MNKGNAAGSVRAVISVLPYFFYTWAAENGAFEGCDPCSS